MNLLTGGLFTLNTVTSLRHELAWPAYFRELAQGGWRTNLDLIVRLMLALGLAVWLVATGRAGRSARWLGVYFLLSAGVSLAQMFKVGSDINYLLEPYALTGTLAALAAERWLSARSARPKTPQGLRRVIYGTAATLAIAVLPLAGAMPDYARSIAPFLRGGFEDRGLMGQAPPVLLMDTAFTYSDPAAHAIPDPFQYVQAINPGRLKADDFVERIERREWRLIAISEIARNAFFNYCRDPRIREAIERNYHKTATTRPPQLWVRNE